MAKLESATYFSRSALAEKLGLTLKELTQGMIAAGWLLHKEGAAKGKEWVLTTKGEFEGGIYRESKKFGQYIVWPESVMNHAVIIDLSEAHITVSTIAKHYDIPAKVLNRLLAEMAWIHALSKGWELTELGRNYGGLQKQDTETGISYVVWPRALLQYPHLKRRILSYKGQATNLTSVVIDQHTHYMGLDGHYLRSQQELIIANWLYIAGLSYAYRRDISLSDRRALEQKNLTDEEDKGNDRLISDFYLPKGNIHIHFNALAESADAIKAQLLRQELVKKHQLNIIELDMEDISRLDQRLPKALLRWGIDVF